MNPIQSSRLLITNLLFTILATFSTLVVSAAENDMEYDGAFKTIENPMEYMASEFKLAKSEDKKVLFVLGGNWCHDSRSLAQKLDTPELSKVLGENYRLSMVDVGFLDKAFEFAEKADMQTFYATPTVLIFDPKSEKLMNGSDMHIWSRAFSLSQLETNEYFKKYAKNNQNNDDKKLTENQQSQLVRLEQFRSTQEARIKASYKILGPLLERRKADKKDENFGPYWQALAKLRFSLPDDIKLLRETILNSSDEELSTLAFPSYETFPWEEQSS